MSFNKNILKISFIICFALIPLSNKDLFAQIILPDNGGVNDVPAAPITEFIGLAIAFGSYIGFRKLKDE